MELTKKKIGGMELWYCISLWGFALVEERASSLKNILYYKKGLCLILDCGNIDRIGNGAAGNSRWQIV